MVSTALLMWGVLFGGIRIGYFIYGRKQKKPVVLISGIGLCVFPYLVSNLVVFLIIGVLLVLAPIVIKI